MAIALDLGNERFKAVARWFAETSKSQHFTIFIQVLRHVASGFGSCITMHPRGDRHGKWHETAREAQLPTGWVQERGDVAAIVQALSVRD